MLLIPRHVEPLQQLANRIRLAATPSCDLIDDLVESGCTRFLSLRAAGRTRRFDEWCRSGAWIDAAYALVALELPSWTVRRIVSDDGAWLCSLSRTPGLPVEIDDTVEASHESMPLAVLAAFVEAKRAVNSATSAMTASPPTGPVERHRLCCDNYS